MRQLTALNTASTYRFDKSQQLLNARARTLHGAYVPENRDRLRTLVVSPLHRCYVAGNAFCRVARGTPEDYARVTFRLIVDRHRSGPSSN